MRIPTVLDPRNRLRLRFIRRTQTRRRRRASWGTLASVLVIASACSDSTEPGSPSHLVFSIPPTSTVVGTTMAPGMAVSVRDEGGETVGAWEGEVTLTLEGGPAGVQLAGSSTIDALAGIALFEELSVSSAGQGFRLRASSGNLEEAVSDPFDVYEGFSASAVFTGVRHTCSLQADGTAHCWGANAEGVLGNGDEYDRPLPTPVSTEVNFVTLSAHQEHTCGLTAGGSVYCWGSNFFGQIGNGTRDDSFLPVLVSLPGPALSVSTGGYHTCALLEGGDGFCWGWSSNGRLGVESEEEYVTSPSPVKGGIQWASLETGYMHVCGLDLQGTAYCWGPNIYGENGDGTRGGGGRTEPDTVNGGHRFARLLAGGAHCHGQSCGYTEAGEILCWGKNYQDNLEPVLDRYVLTPQPIVGDPGFVDLFIGPAFVCGLTGSGGLYCYGDLNHRIYGLDANYTQQPLRLVPNMDVSTVGVGFNYLCVTTTDDEVHCWGDNLYGQLGNPGTGSGTFIPSRVGKPFATH